MCSRRVLAATFSVEMLQIAHAAKDPSLIEVGGEIR